MSDDVEKKPAKSRPKRRVDTYHGTRLAPVRDTPNFTVEEIRRAVEYAIEKNRHLFPPYK